MLLEVLHEHGIGGEPIARELVGGRRSFLE
jgi:hypothetical protein